MRAPRFAIAEEAGLAQDEALLFRDLLHPLFHLPDLLVIARRHERLADGTKNLRGEYPRVFNRVRELEGTAINAGLACDEALFVLGLAIASGPRARLHMPTIVRLGVNKLGATSIWVVQQNGLFRKYGL